MKTYSTIKESESTNTIVKELNASVATATFKSTNGIQKADLYKQIGCCPVLVGHKSCAPVNSYFIGTVSIKF